MERILNFTLGLIGVLFAIAATLWLSSPVHAAVPDLKQETLGYCEARANLALSVLRGMEDGTPIENINIQFEQPPVTEEMATARDAWITGLKLEIVMASEAVQRDKPDWSQRVAQKIIEKCWYDYGKKRVEKQSAAPVTFGFIRTASDVYSRLGLIRTASSQAIADPKVARVEECSETLADQVLIGNMLGSGKGTADDLRAMAANSAAKLGPERFEKIQQLIDEADAAHQKGAVQAWFDDYWHACLDGAN